MDWPRAVLIEGGDGLSVAGYAPSLEREDAALWVAWREAQHERRMLAVWVDETRGPEVIEFLDADGRRWVFRELTLALYESRMRERTIGRPVFGSQAEMLEAMAREW